MANKSSAAQSGHAAFVRRSELLFVRCQPTRWCGVLTDCGTVDGMDAAIEPQGRVHGVSRKR
ncbi:hypothetical protein CAI18_18470 [Xanthomonas citri pv. punicae]|nr:hypothetical protein CAI14_02700 [Xanthomonas citri pv. punicae]QCZ67440.1 hypothetical protein CAI17_00345 [Xanthomonas citri pv. punicae]QCZ71902.1 hypothetical protein CAB38_02690 [Xanthomonas citri pv. punicae]QCZ78136.1 hypothetical protein XapA_16485 [Xanthomonas citri pv. punicae]QCZ82762.1 hypothetical protein XapB_19925 [Xanthomonas citri pv. punicae]